MRRSTTLFLALLLASGPAVAEPITAPVETLLEKGSNAERSDQVAESLRWYRAAAEQGDARGQEALGRIYLDRLGAPEDLAQAVIWFRKAAAQHDRNAETELGMMYAAGWGVKQDYAQALNWYVLAADEGDPVAAEAVGMIYANGLGVPANFDMAKPWLHRAIDGGDSTPIPLLCDRYRIPFAQAEMDRNLPRMDEIISRTDAYCTELLSAEKAARDRVSEDPNSPSSPPPR
jgi:Sel1 repeat